MSKFCCTRCRDYHLKVVTMPNGALVREKVNCDRCGKESKMSNGKKKDTVLYAYYVYNKEKLCRGCMKKIDAL